MPNISYRHRPGVWIVGMGLPASAGATRVSRGSSGQDISSILRTRRAVGRGSAMRRVQLPKTAHFTDTAVSFCWIGRFGSLSPSMSTVMRVVGGCSSVRCRHIPHIWFVAQRSDPESRSCYIDPRRAGSTSTDTPSTTLVSDSTWWRPAAEGLGSESSKVCCFRKKDLNSVLNKAYPRRDDSLSASDETKLIALDVKTKNEMIKGMGSESVVRGERQTYMGRRVWI